MATALCLLGGIAAWIFMTVGLGIAILARVGPVVLQLMTTIPVLVGIGAFLAP